MNKNEYIIIYITHFSQILLSREIEARAKYVWTLYETFRKLFLTRSHIGSWKPGFWNDHKKMSM